ncbi:MAG: RsmB/NOP family class I SAM-dependent RNA methyltransferase, partial [Bacteroidales bacterium]
MKSISDLPQAFWNEINEITDNKQAIFEESLTMPSPVSIRKNPIKLHDLPTGRPIPWCKNGFYLSERPVFTLDILFHAGTYYVQEASSMILEQVFEQILYKTSESKLILDLCAAPGGKSTHILSLINENDLLICNEIDKKRASVLKENIVKWGRSNVLITNNNVEDFEKYGEMFDVIFVDAPCSGEGMFRKDSFAVEQWSESLVNTCSLRQSQITQTAWQTLKTGGLMIYSTCTYNRKENEHIISQLLEN